MLLLRRLLVNLRSRRIGVRCQGRLCFQSSALGWTLPMSAAPQRRSPPGCLRLHNSYDSAGQALEHLDLTQDQQLLEHWPARSMG